MLALQEKKLLPQVQEKPVYYFAPVGPIAFDTLFKLGTRLKRQGISVESHYDKEKALKWHLKQANRVNAHFTVILGEDELAKNAVAIKEMATGQQEFIPLSGLETALIKKAQIVLEAK